MNWSKDWLYAILLLGSCLLNVNAWSIGNLAPQTEIIDLKITN